MRENKGLYILPTVILLGMVMTMAGLVFSQETEPTSTSEDKAAISLVKTLDIRDFEDHKVATEEYEVRSGDSIAKILRRHGVVGKGPIPTRVLRMMVAFNPDLANPDVIVPGQRLVVPTGPVEGIEDNGSPKVPETAVAKPEPPATPKPGSEGSAGIDAPMMLIQKPRSASKDEGTMKEELGTADGKKPSEEPGTQVAKLPAAMPIVPEEKTGNKVVRVREGDSLSKLLIREGVPEDRIFKGFVKLTMKLNPQLKDPNIIFAGQEIVLPLSGPAGVASFSDETRVAKAPVVDTTKTPALPPSTNVRAFKDNKVKFDEEPPSITLPAPELPPSEKMGDRTALALIFTRIGERVVSKGQHFLPLKTGGQITINNETFPMIELRTGHRILLDLDLRLPKEAVEVIRGNWSNYSIFRPKRKETFTSMLGRLLKMGQYFKVDQKGSPLVVERDVKISAGADWIIWPTEGDYASGIATIINLPSRLDLGTSPDMAAFLAKSGINVIDFYPKGNQIGPETGVRPPKAQIKVENLNAAGNDEFAEAMLKMVDQEYEKDLNIPLMKGKSGGTDFNLTIHAPIFFSRAGKNYVVATEALSDEVMDILEDHKYRVITMGEDEGPEELAKKLMKSMGIKTKDGYVVKGSNRPSKTNIEVTIPGIVIENRGEEVLLTHVDVPTDLTRIMDKPSLRVVNYRLRQPS